MKALSIRQPWAWLIVNGHKDVENRTWHTKFRGRFLVHASQGMTHTEYEAAHALAASQGVKLPPPSELERGGIVGSVDLVESADYSSSPWYMGDKAFSLREPRELPFVPMKGRLGFFDVPDDLLEPEP